MGDFPGGPVVKISHSNAGGAGLIPSWGAKIPWELQIRRTPGKDKLRAGRRRGVVQEQGSRPEDWVRGNEERRALVGQDREHIGETVARPWRIMEAVLGFRFLFQKQLEVLRGF